MNNYSNKDKSLTDLKKRLSSYNQVPDKKVWENIERHLTKKHFPFKTLSIIGFVGLVTALAIVLLAPINKQKPLPYKAKQDITDNKGIENAIISKLEHFIIKDKTINPETSDKTPAVKATEPVQDNDTPALSENTSADENTAEITKEAIAEVPAQTTNIEPEKTKKLSESDNITPKTDPNETELPLPEKLYVPNAFTPNSPTNNIFKPAYRDLKSYEMKIYSRSGSLLFTSKDISHGWNGTVKGSLGKAGVYVYVINFTDTTGKKHSQKGSFMLIE